jgi:uncharacterized membrane protein
MDIGFFHPQIVHFVVALLAVGVVARLVSLTGRWSWTAPTASVLLLVGTLAAVAAVKSGDDAHGPAERVPGARDAVVEHEDWGKRTRNVFLIVAALEIAALALLRRPPVRKWLLAGSGVAGLVGLFVLYETAEHGGELVYAYAGGVGVRSGDSADVGRLLLAGFYHQAMLDRRARRPEAAAELIEHMARRWPEDPAIGFLAAESRLLDRKDPAGALAALAAITVAPADTRSTLRKGLLTADAYVAAGRADSARAVLEHLARDFPGNARIRERLERL